MKFLLPDLPYNMVELEPHISKKTLELHYGNHLRAYVTNLNSLIQGTKFENMDLLTIIKIADWEVFNNAAQIWNHIFYFEGLRPGNKGTLKGTFERKITESFGSVSFFKNKFSKAARSLFGVGWVWLVMNQKGFLEIIQEKNAGNPLRVGLIPLLNCDMWEHAYYLDYHDRRQDYIKAFWNLINWDIIEKRYNEALLIG
jgi:Fe-Mn family superoxide dismutase